MTAIDQASTPEAVEATATPRRPLRSRVSGGHLVMLAAGLTAMVLNYAVLRAAGTGTAVAVVTRDVPAGQAVTPELVRFAEVSGDDDVLAGLMTRAEAAALGGHVAATRLRAGDPLRATDVRPPAAPDGQRAMSVPVAPEHAVAGALAPGDRVDVIAVTDGRASYLLTGAAVLEVTSPDARAGLTGTRAFTVTVAVDAERALLLALAIREGHLEVVRATGAPPPRPHEVTGRQDADRWAREGPAAVGPPGGAEGRR